MDTDPTKLMLRLSSKAATDLHAATGVAERMAAKAHAEQERLNARRAKQEQQLAMRANKRAALDEAIEADRLLEQSVSDLEELDKRRKGAKSEILKLQEKLIETRRLSALAEKERERATQRDRNLRDAVTRIEAQLSEEQTPVDGSIVELKSQCLREAWDNSRKAWDRLNKSAVKERRDRNLRRRAKGLLGL